MRRAITHSSEDFGHGLIFSDRTIHSLWLLSYLQKALSSRYRRKVNSVCSKLHHIIIEQAHGRNSVCPLKMEVKEAERVVIAKPVPSRPICSGFRSFSKLLAGAVIDSPPTTCNETVVAAIRPKTVRFRPRSNGASTNVVSSRAEFSGKGVDKSSDEPRKSDSRSYMVYKPKAKLVSKATVSLLANMERLNVNHQQTPQSIKACAQNPHRNKLNFRPQLSPNIFQNIPPFAEAEQRIENSKTTASKSFEEDPKIPLASVIGDRPSTDGYNWRKYGQKQVKGSEYPRSYYKCTYPNCPVKKKVERSLDGQITEIVYQAEHNHPKPYPPRCSSSRSQKIGFASEGSGQDQAICPSQSNQLNGPNEGSESRVENGNEMGVPLHFSFQGQRPLPYEPVSVGITNSAAGTSDSYGPSGEYDEGSKALEAEDNGTRCKRRKTENQSSEASMSVEGSQEPRVQTQNPVDSEILDDGFRWRKYGQKVVRGNPHPRSYYRCTSPKCKARKHVERASDDPRAFITTYEGKHNHEMPLRITHPLNS